MRPDSKVGQRGVARETRTLRCEQAERCCPVIFLQRSRILLGQPQCGTNFLVRCYEFTTALGCHHEISRRQALYRGRWPQNEC
jgi:hypothetical protein